VSAHFSPALFTFLEDLEANNDKVWFDSSANPPSGSFWTSAPG